MLKWKFLSIVIIIEFISLPLIFNGLRAMVENGYSIFHSNKEILPYFFTLKNYLLFFDLHPLNYVAWALMFFTIFQSFMSALSGKVRTQKNYKESSSYGSHGTARWQTDKETKEFYYNSQDGYILGDKFNDTYRLGQTYAVHSTNSKNKLNSQVLVFGPPGSAKTTGLVLPNIFHISQHLKWSMIITDPKSELYGLTSEFLEKEGYEVIALDFIKMKYGKRINPMDFIFEDADLMRVASAFISSLSSGKSTDSFWDESEAGLLSALMGFVKQVYPREHQTFYQVSQVLALELRNPKKALTLFKRHHITGAALHFYNNFLLSEDKVRANILTGLATKLQLFGLPNVQRLTSTSDFDFRQLGEKPTALFLMIPDSHKTYGPIITVLWSVLFESLYYLAYDHNNKLPVPVAAIMDELANIGRIAGFQEKLGTMRGRRIYPMMIWQSLAQMKARYPQDVWKDIVSMCDTQLLLAGNDEDTLKHFEVLLGSKTIQTQNMSNNRKSTQILSNTGAGESFNYMARNLMNIDELRRKDNDYLIVSQLSRAPVVLKKVQYRYWENELCISKERSLDSLPLLPDYADNYDSNINSVLENEELHIKDMNKETEIGIDFSLDLDRGSNQKEQTYNINIYEDIETIFNGMEEKKEDNSNFNVPEEEIYFSTETENIESEKVEEPSISTF